MAHVPSALLAADEPGPFDVVPDDGRSPFFLVCDHASRRIPRALGTLGLPETELSRHIAWDIGAAGLARHLQAALGAFLILQNYSRLVIDCNRPLSAHDSITKRSEHTDVPGNVDVSGEQAWQRAEAIYEPYHGRIRQELERRESAGRETVLVTVHSFTPNFKGLAREWHAGILYHRDPRLAHALLDLLRNETNWVIGDNQPYRVTDDSDVAVMEYGERRRNLHVELEVRQDLIAEEAGQRAWGDRLAVLLQRARERARQS